MFDGHRATRAGPHGRLQVKRVPFVPSRLGPRPTASDAPRFPIALIGQLFHAGLQTTGLGAARLGQPDVQSARQRELARTAREIYQATIGLVFASAGQEDVFG